VALGDTNMVLKEVFFAGLGAVAGGVAGSVITANKVMENVRFTHEEIANPYRHGYVVEDMFEEKGDFSFTYYYDAFLGAFNRVGIKHINALKAKGYTVRTREIHEYLVNFLHKPEKTNDFALVHPMFFTKPEAFAWLEKSHRYIACFEVADTTRISKDYVKRANDPRLDGVFLPSSFCMETYKRSGVMNKLWQVPHGVDPLFMLPKHLVETDDPTLKEIREDKRIKILFFGLHSVDTRKGGDVVRGALRNLRAKGRDFLLVVKIHPLLLYDVAKHFSGIPTAMVSPWLPEKELIYLYDSCDILLHPYRGGAFELNVFEALARGLPVVVTGWGSVLDYANIHNAYLITPESASKIFSVAMGGFFGHIGFGVNPSVDHTVELLEFVMDNVEYCKKRAERQRKPFAEQTWDKVADKILEGCDQIWQAS